MTTGSRRLGGAVGILLCFVALLHSLRACFRSQSEQALVELALRQQLAVLDHGRRRVIHINVTTNPAASWVIQQLREAFPSDNALPFLLCGRDSIFSAEVTATIRSLGTEPVRTVYRSPWQNPFAERVHTCLEDSPDGRPCEARPPPSARLVALPRIGGLRHRYAWRQPAYCAVLRPADALDDF